jgi:hypothetical protein
MTNPFSPFLFEILSNNNQYANEIFQDFTGTLFLKDSFPAIPEPQQASSVIPMRDGDGFRAGSNEWGGFGLAVSLVMGGFAAPCIVELGSSQGLWCFPWINVLSRKHVDNISALGIEAGNAFSEVESFWNLQKKYFKLNKGNNFLLFEGNDWKFRWIHGAVATGAAEVEFPDISVSKNNGASINNGMQHEISRMIKVKVINPQKIVDEVKLLSEKSEIGLLHIDLQGEELNLMQSGELNLLLRNTSVTILGTHSVEADVLALTYFHNSGFTLISMEVSEYTKDEGKRLLKDGEQIWIRNDLFQKCLEQGWISDSQTINVVAENFRKLLEYRKDFAANQ